MRHVQYLDAQGRSVTADEALRDGRVLRTGYTLRKPIMMHDSGPVRVEDRNILGGDGPPEREQMKRDLANAWKGDAA